MTGVPFYANCRTLELKKDVDEKQKVRTNLVLLCNQI